MPDRTVAEFEAVVGEAYAEVLAGHR